MHDLIAFLTKFVSKEYCLTLEEGNSIDIMMKEFHLAYVTAKRLDSVFEVVL